MQIGTMRPEEAKTFDTYAGYHQFTDEKGEKFGSFEIFFHDGGHMIEQGSEDDMPLDEWRDAEKPGWYWRSGFNGCLPDGEAFGPFATSRDAREDADENWIQGFFVEVSTPNTSVLF